MHKGIPLIKPIVITSTDGTDEFNRVIFANGKNRAAHILNNMLKSNAEGIVD